MRRDGFALAGAGVVMMKELADNLSSVRMRLLELLVFVAGAGAVYATLTEVRSIVSEDPFVFLRLFTTPKAPLPSFVAFLGFLIPIVTIALGFDSVNSEFNHRTMSRLLAQPIYRDALLFGKFLAGLATLAITLTALWLFVIGLGVLLLGLPPSGEEVARGFTFLLAAIAYSGVWLALALLFSVVFRSAATAALAALSVWLLFAFFWSMLVSLIAPIVAPTDPDNLASLLHNANVTEALSRLSRSDAALFQQLLHLVRELHQPQQIAHRRARAPHGLGCGLMREPEFLDEPRQRARLFQRIQVLALDVFDERHGEGGLVRHVADDHRYLGEAGHLGRAPAALAGNDLVAL